MFLCRTASPFFKLASRPPAFFDAMPRSCASTFLLQNVLFRQARRHAQQKSGRSPHHRGMRSSTSLRRNNRFLADCFIGCSFSLRTRSSMFCLVQLSRFITSAVFITLCSTKLIKSSALRGTASPFAYSVSYGMLSDSPQHAPCPPGCSLTLLNWSSLLSMGAKVLSSPSISYKEHFFTLPSLKKTRRFFPANGMTSSTFLPNRITNSAGSSASDTGAM